ncbi:MAG: 16S rRNA (adenine(1518)-N(6)/adenine(1519)-N(6))-dimethyltransferase RsmA [Promethearchaeota archaeon]
MNSRKETLKQELLRVSRKLKLRLNKNTGQCILIDENVAKFMVNQLVLKDNFDIVLEIGPGFGALTEKIIPRAKKVITVEYDHGLAEYLENKFSMFDNIEIIREDALDSEFKFPKHTKFISNVPFHISGPLIHKIINSEYQADKIVLLLQHEFIKMLQSDPKPKKYGRLSVAAGLFFNIEYIKKTSPSVFFPVPSVNGGIINVTFKNNIPEVLRDLGVRGLFFEFLSGIFPYKNKTIKKCIEIFFDKLKKNPESFSPEILNHFKNGFQGYKQTFQTKEPIFKRKRLRQLNPQEILDLFSELIFG